MKLGTKSVLYGAHAFWLHPFMVARGWCKLYGFPWDPRLWVCFFVHDIGYIGCDNMDGETGKRHPEAGANLVGALFGDKWGDLCLYHSRGYARRDCAAVSKLCWADKLATVLTPAWLYMPLTKATGELNEYMNHTRFLDTSHREDDMPDGFWSDNQRDWYTAFQALCLRDVVLHAYK